MKRHANSVSGPVTIIDVAREAGVSYATVSRVINNEVYVKAETRQRVTEALTKMGYVGNRQARSLRGGRSHTIGLLVPDLSTSYVGEIARGIGDELIKQQYDLMLYTTHWREQSEASHVATLTQGMVDGLLLVLPRSPQSYVERLRALRFPYVLIDHQGIDCEGAAVGAANLAGGYEGTKHLIELGHRRIGFITGDIRLGCSQERLQGYRNAMREANLCVDERWIIEGNFLQPSGYHAGTKLLQLAERPTAIFASNDIMAIGVMEAVRERGLRIPDDVSIVGFDDIPQAANMHPTLTTVHQPLEDMGRVATQLLFEYMADIDLAEKRVVLPTHLVVRNSCRAAEQSRVAL